MDVRIHDVPDSHPEVGRRPQVVLGRVHRINYDARTLAPAAQEVGDGDNRIGMEELAEDHAPRSIGRPDALQSGKPSLTRRA